MRRDEVGVWILGGLGNQLFQYAAAYGIAIRLDTDPRIAVDRSTFEDYPLRTYQLDALGLPATAWHGPPCRELLRPSALWRRGLLRLGLPAWPGIRILRERSFHADPRLLAARPPCYLHGHWQSERWFAHAAGRLRPLIAHGLDRAAGPDPRLAGLVDGRSVAVHLRRGDYASDAKTRDYHGVVPLDWYRQAMALVSARLPDARFHIISDDPSAAAELAAGRSDAHAETPGSGFADLRLISACRHQIIANSSFSWWGAWLAPGAPGRERMVLAPRVWFAPAVQAPLRMDDLYPAGWEVL